MKLEVGVGLICALEDDREVVGYEFCKSQAIRAGFESRVQG